LERLREFSGTVILEILTKFIDPFVGFDFNALNLGGLQEKGFEI
jgi:hypothetical protein